MKEYTDNPRFDKALIKSDEYSWIIFTSANGAELFFKRLRSLGIDIRRFLNKKFAAIGSRTAKKLEEHGIFADLVPDRFTAKTLGEKLSGAVNNNDKLLILRAEQGSDELTDVLRASNINFDDIKIYDLSGNPNFSKGYEIDTDFITFASPSGVKFFFDNNYKISSKTKIICIGEVTAEELKKQGINDFYTSEVSTSEGIAEVILREVEHAKIQTPQGK